MGRGRKSVRVKRKEREEEGEMRKGRSGRRLVVSSSYLRVPTIRILRSKVRLRDKGYALRSRDSSYFGLFSTLRVMWLCFCLKGLCGRMLECGNAALFNPTHCPDFGIGFRLGK